MLKNGAFCCAFFNNDCMPYEMKRSVDLPSLEILHIICLSMLALSGDVQIS